MRGDLEGTKGGAIETDCWNRNCDLVRNQLHPELDDEQYVFPLPVGCDVLRVIG